MNIITVERAINDGILPHQLEWCADWNADIRGSLSAEDVAGLQRYAEQEKALRKVAKALARSLKLRKAKADAQTTN